MAKQTRLIRYTGYPATPIYMCIEAYRDTDGGWLDCPCCGLKPKQWVFNNGRSTGCGCGNSDYDHFSIHAESIMSVHNRTDGKRMTDYVTDDLKNNWNHWVETGQILFEHASKRDDGLW